MTAHKKVNEEDLGGEHKARPESPWRGGGVDCTGLVDPGEDLVLYSTHDGKPRGACKTGVVIMPFINTCHNTFPPTF